MVVGASPCGSLLLCRQALTLRRQSADRALAAVEELRHVLERCAPPNALVGNQRRGLSRLPVFVARPAGSDRVPEASKRQGELLALLGIVRQEPLLDPNDATVAHETVTFLRSELATLLWSANSSNAAPLDGYGEGNPDSLLCSSASRPT